MAVLEGVVVAMIIVTGAYVGYHAWQEWLHEPAEAHRWPDPAQLDVARIPAELADAREPNTPSLV